MFKKISAQQFFQITALCFGLAIAIIIPPFQVPDETDHFERAFHLAEGHFWGEQQNRRLGGELPESIARFEAIYLPLKFDAAEKQSSVKFDSAAAIELKPAIKTFQDFPNTGLYPFTAYIPQIIAVKAGVLAQVKPLYLLYLTRIFTLFFWIVLISKAIQLMPVYQWELAFLALLPGSMFINASASGDVVTNGVAFLVLAFFYRKIIEKDTPISRTQLGWLSAGIAVLALNKFVYAPLVLLCFLIPKTAFKQPQHRNIVATGLLCFAITLVALWNLKTSALFLPKDQYHLQFRELVTLNEGVNPQAQFLFIIQHPVQYLKILSHSFAETAPATLAHYFGKFGWGKNYLPGWTIAVLLLTTLVLFLRKPQLDLPARAKMVFFALAVIMSIGLATTLYMMWAPVGNDRVLSLSGKYFIPILPLVWLALPKVLKFEVQKSLIISVILPALAIGLLAAYWRFY